MYKNNFSGVVSDRYLSPRFLEPTGTTQKHQSQTVAVFHLTVIPRKIHKQCMHSLMGVCMQATAPCEHVPPTRPQDLPLLELPPATPMILTICPPPRLRVTLFRHVSLSVSPHFRSSASTVKILLSQGCRGRYRSWHMAHLTFPLLQSMLPPLAGKFLIHHCHRL